MGSSCSRPLGRSSPPESSDDDQARPGKVRLEQGAMNVGGRMEIGTININNNKPTVTHAQGEKRDALIGFFKFPSMTNRRDNIDSTYRETCTWLLKTSEWDQWRRSSSSLLWIKGNPGAGKSTMMKYAVKNVKRKPGEHVVSHFFNARGAGELEKSAEGLYRALLVQLLRDLPPDRFSESKSLREAAEESAEKKWPLPELLELLQEVLKLLAQDPVTIFLDALDECNEQQLQDMVDCLCDLLEARSSTQLRICFASRYFPHITREGAIDLWLEKQKDHYQDVYVYIEGQLDSSKMKISKHIRTRLQEKAAGSFIWAYLVIRLLKNEYRKGQVADLEAMLESLPEKLEDLYKNILDNRQGTARHETLMCYKWVLCARRPLKVEELWWAIRISITKADSDVRTLRDYTQMSDDDVRRRLLDISCGLVSPSEGGETITVQFIHETTRKFCLQEAGLGAAEEIAATHEFFKESCWRTIQLAITLRESPRSLEAPPQDEIVESWEQFPLRASTGMGFSRYASNYVLAHANQAQGRGSDQSDFLAELMTIRKSIASIYESETDVRRRVPNPFLRYTNLTDLLMAGEHYYLVSDCENMKQLALKEIRLGLERDEKHETALTEAMDRGRLQTVLALLVLHMNRREEFLQIRNLLVQLGKKAHNKLMDPQADRTFVRVGLSYTDVLFDLAEDIDEVAAFFLVSMIAPAVISPKGFARLSAAAQEGFTQILSFVLSEKIVARWTTFSVDDALLWASRNGHTAIAKTLLEDYQPNLRPESLMPDYIGPLAEALASRHIEIAKLLVKYDQPELF
ncbi:hypothetical protein CC79DRAFT_1364594 [Sarocladium strictum]